MAQPEEIANAILFVASKTTSYLTGINITMDGAQSTVRRNGWLACGLVHLSLS
jgi:NAD(P)-dependent dehydrogenase (short-subunit alcohol dehydrogenase family)